MAAREALHFHKAASERDRRSIPNCVAAIAAALLLLGCGRGTSTTGTFSAEYRASQIACWVSSIRILPGWTRGKERWENTAKIVTKVASAIQWLLSSEQGWVTGHVMAVDGGVSSLQSRMASNPRSRYHSARELSS